MNILITGSNGLLGRNLVKLLCNKHKIYAIVRNENFYKHENVEYINLDLFNFDTNDLPGNIDAIYYLAQSKKFRDFPSGAKDIFEINVNSPFKLIDWAVKNNIKKFYYASSGGVYKNPTSPVDEFFDINANNKNGFYLDSKLSSEILLKNFSSYFESFAILRPFFIYGPDQDKTMLIPRLINNIIDSNEIILHGDQGIKINPIYVEDAALAFEKLLHITGEFIFNIAGDEIITIKELTELISEIINNKPVFKHYEQKQSDLIANISLMKEKLHSPQVSIKEGINRIIKEM